MKRQLILIAILAVTGCGESKKPESSATQPGSSATGKKLVVEKNCTSLCHKAGNPMAAPLLEDAMRARRAKLVDYGTIVERLMTLEPERYEKSKQKIDAIAAEKDAEARLRLWLHAYLEKTTFDDAKNKMLDMNPKLSAEELDHLSAYLAELGR